MIETLLASCATLLVVLGYIPQIVKAVKTKSMYDVSMGFLVMVATGVLLWLLYGIVVKDQILIIANAVTLSFATSLIIMKLHYEK